MDEKLGVHRESRGQLVYQITLWGQTGMQFGQGWVGC